MGGFLRSTESNRHNGIFAFLRMTNFIYDLSIGLIEEPYIVNDIINSIPGVVENGLFVEMADLVILGGENKAEVIEK